MNAKSFIIYIIVAVVVGVLLGVIGRQFLGLDSAVVAAITGAVVVVIFGGARARAKAKKNK